MPQSTDGLHDKQGGVPRLVLASASPRRRELLAEAGYTFEVSPSPFPEPDAGAIAGCPMAYAEAVSYFKARTIAERQPEALVIGADTVVALDAEIFGKPADREDARRILSRLMHHPHQVITGLCLIHGATDQRIITHAVSVVEMKPMEPDVFEDYLESGLWDGKAGAYGIQDHSDAFVRHIEGSYTNVMGLPMELLEGLLADWKLPCAKGTDKA